MEDLYRWISDKLITFFHKAGLYWLEKNSYIVILCIIFLILPIIKTVWKGIYSRVVKYLRYKNLSPYFDRNEIENATKYFVQTEFQNIDPANEVDYSSNESYAARQKLIPFFTKKSFKNKNDKKYFLILADSGMGKTTLLVNLYFSYLKWYRPKNLVKLFPLGKKDIDKDISHIAQDSKRDTILLLDGFDEDQQAVEDYIDRIRKIVDLTSGFKKIVISSRTHFFSNVNEEPYETGLMKFGGDKGQHFFHKVYIAPFSEEDVKKYLNKKYSILLFRRKKRAKHIVRQCPNLMMRPMLLAYIDDLVKSKVNYTYSFQIYQTLIDKWIEREASRVSYHQRDEFRNQLYKFSRVIARNIYENQKAREGLFIESEKISQFANSNGIILSELDLRSRSLLNRNSAGEYKFSHKSILEFFLSVDLFEDKVLVRDFNYESMPLAKEFYAEMCGREVVSRTMTLNKDVPFNRTVHLDLRRTLNENYGLDLSFTFKKRNLTILNLSEIDDHMLSVFSDVEYLNVLVSRFLDLPKLYSFKNLKCICLLNEAEFVTEKIKQVTYSSDSLDLTDFIEDFKKLIVDLFPQIEIEEQLAKSHNKSLAVEAIIAKRGFGLLPESERWMDAEKIKAIKGTHDSVVSELYYMYNSKVLPFVKLQLSSNCESKNWFFVKIPLDNAGKLVKDKLS